MKKILIALLALLMLLTSCNTVHVPSNTPDETDPPLIEPNVSDNPPSSTPEIPADGTDEVQNIPPTTSSVGGFVPCIHAVMDKNLDMDFAYHTFAGPLIAYVGSDAFYAWKQDRDANKQAAREAYECGEANCPYVSTIVDFVNDFNISREVFELLITNVRENIDYNVDAIYAGKDAAEKYYTSERSMEAISRNLLYYVKGEIAYSVRNSQTDAFESWTAEKSVNGWYGSELYAASVKKLKNEKRDTSILPEDVTVFTGTNIAQFSITELVHTFDIPRNTIENIFNTYIEGWEFSGTVDIDAMLAADWDAEYYKTTRPLDIDMQYFTFEENIAN